MTNQCITSRLAGSNVRSESSSSSSSSSNNFESESPEPRFTIPDSEPLSLTPGFNPGVPATHTPPSTSTPPKRQPRQPKFKLRKHHGVWELSRGTERAILKHEVGLDYVAYLMTHPDEPIHGLALALKIRAVKNGEPIESADVIQERVLALDDIDAARRLYRKQRELEGMIDDPLTVEAVRDEAYAQLKDILEYQKKNISRTNSQAQKASDAVGKALKRLYAKLNKASDTTGQPHLLLRAFADHIRQSILIPSGRTMCQGGARVEAEAGLFRFTPNKK